MLPSPVGNSANSGVIVTSDDQAIGVLVEMRANAVAGTQWQHKRKTHNITAARNVANAVIDVLRQPASVRAEWILK
jgi:hypothetical protein